MARRTPLLGVALAIGLFLAPANAQAQSPCANADLQPTGATTAAARDAVICLVNVHRTAQGLKPVKSQANLQLAAERHSADMVARTYFEHISPEGKSVAHRAAAAGYTKAHSWMLGEALGVGLSNLSTPAAMVQAWMDSPPHRAVLLERRYTDIGIGIVAAMDADGTTGAAYTAAFGKRTKGRGRVAAGSSSRIGHRAQSQSPASTKPASAKPVPTKPASSKPSNRPAGPRS